MQVDPIRPTQEVAPVGGASHSTYTPPPSGDSLQSHSSWSCLESIKKIFTAIYNFFMRLFKKEQPSELVEAFGGAQAFEKIPELKLTFNYQITDRFFDLPHPIVKGAMSEQGAFVALKIRNKETKEELVLSFFQKDKGWRLEGITKLAASFGFNANDRSSVYKQVRQIIDGTHPKLELGVGNPRIEQLLKTPLKDEHNDLINPWQLIGPPSKEHLKVATAFPLDTKYTAYTAVGERAVGYFDLKPEEFSGIAIYFDQAGRIAYSFKWKFKNDPMVFVETFYQKFCNNPQIWFSKSEVPNSELFSHIGMTGGRLTEEHFKAIKQIAEGKHPKVELVLN